MLTNKKKLGILAAFFFILAAVLPLASARMDPLMEVKSQIKTPNMLIILDTSGSMSFRPSDSTVVGGDTSTSRMYIAKDVIKSVVSDSYEMMNFGLMSFDQKHISLGDSTGYFPYYKVSTTCTTQTEFFSDRDLIDWGYFTLAAGPSATFTRRGTVYTLQTSNNSQFHRGFGRRGRWGSDTDHSYNQSADSCYIQNNNGKGKGGGGQQTRIFCTFSGYTWEYQGSYYTYQHCDPSTTKKYVLNYLGTTFVDDGTITGTAGTYVYPDFPNNYYSTGLADGSQPIDYDQNYGDLLVRISTDPTVQTTKANEILAWMALQNNGGLVAIGGTPTGVTLENAVADPNQETLLSNASAASPAIGDGTSSPPSSVTYTSKTWTLEDFGLDGNSSYSCSKVCTPTAGTGTSGSTCSSDTDCLSCLDCASSRCNYCGSGGDCPTGLTCSGNRCVTPTLGTSGSACSTNADCVSCLQCYGTAPNKKCGACTSTNQCEGAMSCTSSACTQGTVGAGACGGTCTADSQCKKGMKCKNGLCGGCTVASDCGTSTTLTCTSGLCGGPVHTGTATATCGASCTNDTDCMTGMKCKNSICGGCSSSSDCGGLTCTGGVCVGAGGTPVTTTATKRMDYQGKSYSYSSTCNTGTTCTHDSDCGYGGSCTGGYCDGTGSPGTATNTCTYAGSYYIPAGVLTAYNDAFHYFKNEVIHDDPMAKNGCRKNYIILVTDGEPNGPPTGSETCDSALRPSGNESDCPGNTGYGSCGSPTGNASKCAAYDLSHLAVGVGGRSTPVITYVVGFGAATAGSALLDAIAQQGGSPLKSDGHYAYYASDAAALEDSLRAIINEAARGDYTTAPPSYTYSAGGTGTVVFFSSAQYPEWNGHLRAVDAAKNQLIWDAGAILSARTATRNIYTSDPSTTPAYPIAFTTTNLSALRALGLGASDAEARAIIIFIHGKSRSWRLGDIVNSAPATLTPPPWRKLDAFNYQNFFDTYGYQLVSGRWVPKRNILVFTGANDGMFHAFTMESVTSGGTTIDAGDEVWAYIPPDLLPRLKDLYLNGGQISAADNHLYYVAASPKIEDICIDSSSPADGVCDSWLTALVCGEGPGGAHVFALDVTHPSPNDPNYDASRPFTVLWTTSNTTNTGLRSDVNKLGETFSNPAFGKVRYLSGSLTLTEDAIFMGSGYDDINPGNVSHSGVGTSVYVLRAQDGTAIKSFNAGDAPSGAITEYSLLANTVAYGFGSMFGWSTKSGSVDTWNLSDIVQADLGGKIWTAITSADTNKSNWTMTTSYDAGSGQPFYYSPAMATIQVAGGTPQYINIVAAISGAYADPDMASTTFTPKVFLFQDANGTFTSFSGFPKTIDNFQETVGGTSFPARTRPTGSPLIAIDDNGTRDDPSDDFIGIILTLFVPPDLTTSPCSYGEGYVVILKITGLYTSGVAGATVAEAYAHKVSDSMPSPPFIVRGALVMTESGHGSDTATITTIGNVGVVTTTNGNAKFLYWKEVR
ncbi:MAG: hypothetical protein PHE84_02180 [bacterium]|nr:hypothetical protein [bacterium]